VKPETKICNLGIGGMEQHDVLVMEIVIMESQRTSIPFKIVFTSREDGEQLWRLRLLCITGRKLCGDGPSTLAPSVIFADTLQKVFLVHM
jgi:hypothetical protein